MGISMNEESYSIISLIAMNRIRLSLQYQTFVDSGIRRICISIYILYIAGSRENLGKK